LPIDRLAELNTWHFLEQCPSATFFLPVVKADTTLIHVKYESKAQIQTSEWGIPEPLFGEEIEADELDLVLIPLLAIDQKGYRVGYGKGFYDQFLGQCSSTCQFIGLTYFDPIDEIFDVHENDIPVHACVTPNQVFTF